jgi:hypothetical protein
MMERIKSHASRSNCDESTQTERWTEWPFKTLTAGQDLATGRLAIALGRNEPAGGVSWRASNGPADEKLAPG